MTTSSTSILAFIKRPGAVAVRVTGDELRTLSAVPAGWVALATDDAERQQVMAEGARLEPAAEVMLARKDAVPVDLTFSDLATADGFLAEVVVRLRLAVGAERSDLAAFRGQVLGAYRAATADNLARYVLDPLRDAAVAVCRAHDAAVLSGPEGDDRLCKAVDEALAGPCFTGGLQADARPEVEFRSEAYLAVLRAGEQAQRRKLEHEAASELREALREAQDRHLDHLSSMLERVRGLADASPGVELAGLLKSFSDVQRGELYDALFRAKSSTTPTSAIVVSTGSALEIFDPRDPVRPVRSITIDGSAGPVRSVQADPLEAGLLWLGAARGVYGLRLGDEFPAEVYLYDGGANVRGGFNSVARDGARIVASHSELGLVTWDRGEQREGRAFFSELTRGAGAVRGACVSDGQWYATVEDRAIAWRRFDDALPGRIYTGAGATLTALQPVGAELFAGTSDGRIVKWGSETPGEPEIVREGGGRAVESVWLLSSHGVRRLVFADTSPRVVAMVLGDSFRATYEAGGQTLRRVEVADDLIVATSDLRDRLFLWTPGEGQRPLGVIPVASLCGRHIQDVCLVPSTSHA